MFITQKDILFKSVFLKNQGEIFSVVGWWLRFIFSRFRGEDVDGYDLFTVAGVDNYSHGTVVDERYLHIRSEYASFYLLTYGF